MARGDQLARQWAILIELGRGRRSRRGLATRFDVSLRTIARDIDALSRFPIVEERDGIDVFYRCLPSYRPPQVRFTPAEAAALIMGTPHAVDAVADLPIAADFRAALAKIERLATAGATRQVRGLPQVFQVDLAPPTVATDHQDALIDAALTHRRVWLRYHSAARDVEGERIVEPFCLHRHPHGLHLIAWCLTRDAFVNLNVNLIRGLRVLEERFDPAARAFEREAFLAASFDGHHGAPIIDVRLRIAAPSAHWLRDRFFHATQQIVALEAGAVEVRFRAGGVEAIVDRVLSLGPDCTVIAPESLRRAVHTRALAVANAHGEDP